MYYKFENCANSVESCVVAQRAGVDRVELCAGMPEGGTTPSYGDIVMARRVLTTTKLHVIIRPRGGDFLYSDLEKEIMIEDVRMARSLGVDGVVFGALTPEGDVDMEFMRRLMQEAEGMSVTFHRAIDRSRDIYEALEDVISLGVERVLTSGGKPSAIDALETISAMNRLAAGRVTVMAGSGVNAENVKEIIAATGVSEVHFSAASHFDSPMVWRGDQDSSLFLPDSFIRTESSYETIQEIMAAVK